MRRDRYPVSTVGVTAFALWVVITTPVGFAGTAQQAGPADTAKTQAAKPSDFQADAAHATPISVPMPMTVEEVMHPTRPSDLGAQLGRWFDVSTAALGVRYRTLEANPDPTANDLQNTVSFRGRFKLDRSARYAVHGRLASGHGFNGGWNNTGIGTSPRSQDLLLKELFVVAQPTIGLEIQAGGLYIARGESTEATSYDNDGYIVGERLVVRRGLASIVDEISLTRAFLGDLTDANVLTRLRHVDRANYYQFQGIKRIALTSVSADYTRQDSIHVVRAALSVDNPGSVLLDGVSFENYARVKPALAYGYAITVRRHVTGRLMAGGGLSDIDSTNGPLNSDLNRTGRRVYWSLSRRIGSAWLGSAQVARVIGSEPFAGPRTRVDFALGLDVLRELRRNSSNPR